jgi:hypothetical protein
MFPARNAAREEISGNKISYENIPAKNIPTKNPPAKNFSGTVKNVKNKIDYLKRFETFNPILPKCLHQMFNTVRDEQKIACHKRSEQLH